MKIGNVVEYTETVNKEDLASSKYIFEVEAFDKHEKIGFRKHERVVTKAARFMEMVHAKGTGIG